MPTNPCAAILAVDGVRCGRPAWFLDPATVRLYCHDHKPVHARDTLPSLVAEFMRDPNQAAECLRDPILRALVAEMQAEVERRLTASNDADEPPF